MNRLASLQVQTPEASVSNLLLDSRGLMTKNCLKPQQIHLFIILMSCLKPFRNISPLTVVAAIISVSNAAYAASVKIEAESGMLGANFADTNISGAHCITITTDSTAQNPGSADRVATYSVTFPEAGTYELYARVYVGPGGADDDSFFYGNGFGSKSPTSDTDWITSNNHNSSGYTGASDVVTNNGSAGGQVWKWVNLSEYSNGGETPMTFVVPAGNLAQTFQIGARENGFAIDALLFGTSGYLFTVADLDAGGPGNPPPPPPPPMPRDLVSGNLIQFNDNGCWTWYVDERALVDPDAKRVIVGCVENGNGVGGVARDGNISATFFDLQSRTVSKTTLKYALTSFGGGDDHNAPGMTRLPGGKYLAFYTGHNADQHSYYSVYDPITGWGPDTDFDWSTQPGGDDFNTSYSHPYYLSAEDITYNFSRGNGKSPNFLYSTNLGATWTYGGQLTTNDNIGYVNGYFKFWGNGVDRIDFLCTEYHPRDFNNSIYHGYISNHMSFRDDGTVMDTNIFDKLDLPQPQDFTPVFTAGTVDPAGQTNYRCWNDDICRYSDGTITCIISTRLNNNVNGSDANINPDHAFFYCRYDGTHWSHTYLCKAGTKLYSSEADYVGLGSVDPSDPNIIYISTTYDPRTDTLLGNHEIWKGVSTNNGAGFNWTQITRDSDQENFRPIVPAWDRDHTALLWFRGTYTSAQILNVAIVGLIQDNSEIVGPMSYVDATTSNTTLTNGSPLVLGAGANQWHDQTAGGNGGSVISSADSSAEDAPMIKTQVTLPGAGTYDVWANFWGKPTADWRIVSGLAPDKMQLFREMACKEVEPGDHASAILLTNAAGYFLYQAYLGRVTNSSLDVFVDDNVILTGTTNTTAGNTVRTWYDGVSYAQVNPPSGTPYNTWVAGYTLSGDDALPDTDYDKDGDPNAVEFVKGGNPAINDSAATASTYSAEPDYFAYSFRRTDVSNVPGGYVGEVYYTTDFMSWTKAQNGINGVVITEDADFYGAGVDRVTVRFPYSLSAGGHLFVQFGVSPAGP
jgi:hypothetical protein